MKKRVFIIHGWDGYPEEGWFPWLKKELEQRSFEVFVPAMPNSGEPKIKEWIPFLVEIVGEIDENTYFVGHSIGCQAVLRYIETLPGNVKIKGIVLVAPWMKLDNQTIEEEGEDVKRIAKLWTETPINFNKVKINTNKSVVIFSDKDKYVPLKENRKIFETELNAKIIIEHNKGHFSGSDGVIELPSVLNSILSF
jgi:hypothetical protein